VGIKTPEDRLNFVRKAVASVIADEVDAVEEVVGYIGPKELIVVLFDIAIKHGKDSSFEPGQLDHIFQKCLAYRTLTTVVVGPIAEA